MLIAVEINGTLKHRIAAHREREPALEQGQGWLNGENKPELSLEGREDNSQMKTEGKTFQAERGACYFS